MAGRLFIFILLSDYFQCCAFSVCRDSARGIHTRWCCRKQNLCTICMGERLFYKDDRFTNPSKQLFLWSLVDDWLLTRMCIYPIWLQPENLRTKMKDMYTTEQIHCCISARKEKRRNGVRKSKNLESFHASLRHTSAAAMCYAYDMFDSRTQTCIVPDNTLLWNLA